MKYIILGVLSTFMVSCLNKKGKHQLSTPTYFKLDTYFENEINRLQLSNPTINKEVLVKDKLESRKLHIKDWNSELTTFKNSDINKDSWKGDFKIVQSKNQIIYETENPKISIKKVEIFKQNQKVVGVKIYKVTNNYLYRSIDTLVYFPDSLYSIKSQQNIRFLKEKQYQIKGTFE